MAKAAPSARNRFRGDPDVVTLRPGMTDPETGRRIPTGGGGRPRWATDEAIQAEQDAQDEARSPRGRARRAANIKAPTLGKVGRRAADAAAVKPARLRTDASGFVLALLFWSWVALPVLQGGPAAVKDTLRAKFFNKDANGEWLP